MIEPLLRVALEAALEKKANNPVILDLEGLSAVADFFLICSGATTVQTKAIADQIALKLREEGLAQPGREGYQDGRWVLLDCGAIVIQVMHQEEREFYDLESLWHDARRLPWEQELKPV